MNIRSDTLTPNGVVASPDVVRKERLRRRYLFNRWIDFLGLGGGSLFVLAAVAAFYPEDEASIAALVFTLVVFANFVNHPHFAHSYQIFYGGFIRKAFSPDAPLRHRYLFAGIMVPAVMTVFFATTVALGNAALLGLGRVHTPVARIRIVRNQHVTFIPDAGRAAIFQCRDRLRNCNAWILKSNGARSGE